MKEPYKDLHWHSRDTIRHSYPLTDNQKLELGEEMADARVALTKLEAELTEIKKDFKERMDAEAGKVSSAAVKLKSGLDDPVPVECDVYQDFEHEEMVYVSVDSEEELMRRPMSENEKRPNLISMLGTTGAKINHLPKDATR